MSDNALCPRAGERFGAGPVSVHPECKPPLLDSPEAAMVEIAWVAREARALMEADRAELIHGQAPEAEREARFTARKRALLAYIERREAQR